MNKKLLVLLGVYASGVAAALLYNKKTPQQIQSELHDAQSAGENNLKVLFSNFIEIHQNFLDTLKVKLFTDENKQKFSDTKDEFLAFVQDFKAQGESLVEEYKKKGRDYANEGMEKLEQVYNDTVLHLEKLKGKAPDKIDFVKQKLVKYFDELKSKLKK